MFQPLRQPDGASLTLFGLSCGRCLAIAVGNRDSCRGRGGLQQVAQADQVVGDHVQAKHSTDFLGASQLELAQTAPLFYPAKHFLDAAAGVDRFGVALVARGTAINGGTAKAGGVLCHVRCHPNTPEFRNHSLGVVVLVGTQCCLVGTGDASRHLLGGIPFFGDHRLRDAAVDDQRLMVVHEQMAPVAWQCWMGIGFPAQQCVGICAGAMSLVAELDAAEITLGPFFPVLGSTESFPSS